jgi:hypothetical protein
LAISASVERSGSDSRSRPEDVYFGPTGGRRSPVGEEKEKIRESVGISEISHRLERPYNLKKRQQKLMNLTTILIDLHRENASCLML